MTKWLICCGSIMLAWMIFPTEVLVYGSWGTLIAVGTVLWLINLVIRPVAQFVSFPATILTFGLFSVIVNAAMVRLADILIPVFEIRSFLICIFIALFISVGNMLFVGKPRNQ